MKIVIPSADGKLCGHFGHCDYFTFAEIESETNEISNLERVVPEGGVSCQSAGWLAEQGIDVVLAGGMGGRPQSLLEQSGIKVVTGCPELGIEEILRAYLSNNLTIGENSCGGEHHHCHGHSHESGHHCGGHH